MSEKTEAQVTRLQISVILTNFYEYEGNFHQQLRGATSPWKTEKLKLFC